MSANATPTRDSFLLSLATDHNLNGRVIKFEDSGLTAIGVITGVAADDHELEISVKDLMYLERSNRQVYWGAMSSEIFVYTAHRDTASAHEADGGTFRILARSWNADIYPTGSPFPKPGVKL